MVSLLPTKFQKNGAVDEIKYIKIKCCIMSPPTLVGRHIVFVLSVCPSHSLSTQMYIYNLKEVVNCNDGDNSKQTNEFLYVIGAGIFNNEQSLDISHQCLKGG
jgi:hypothetical protein